MWFGYPLSEMKCKLMMDSIFELNYQDFPLRDYPVPSFILAKVPQ